jgi:choline dehydrogenase
MRPYDYVVVGGGSAGCVVASRLAEQADARVLLLEAGEGYRHWTIDMPSAFGRNFQGGRFNWAFWTVPQRHLAGRRVFQPAGRALGGSSAINGMVFLRGHPLDFDRWAFTQGATGWSYAEVLPYFRRSERYLGPASPYRGTSGPVTVQRGEAHHPLDAAFLQAGIEAGFPSTDDPNGYQQEGFSPWDANIEGGVRASSARAYIDCAPAGILDIKANALAIRVLFDHARAAKVQYVDAGRLTECEAAREIILCAGALRSPQLLMLSGIGPADELRRHGIPVVADVPGVGQNLQDHMYVMIQYESLLPITLNGYAARQKMIMAGLQWLLTKQGVCSTNHIEVGAFLNVGSGARHPDGQLHFKPVLLEGWNVSRRHGFNFGAGTLRPASRGTLKLQSPAASDPPAIDPNYLAAPEDLADMRDLVKLTRELAHRGAFARFRGAEVSPGPSVRTDKEINDFLAHAAGSGFHPCGTCRMGSDELAVCSPDLRVRGVDRLRIADASAFPSLVSANTNAATLMLAERASDLIRGIAPQPAIHLPVHPAAHQTIAGSPELMSGHPGTD